MIKQIEIKNFQSHKHTIIDLSKGINIFVGTSNHGKSAIIRALLWVITNRPVGTGYVSHWNWKKDFMIEETSVTITFNNHIIIRKRFNDFNGYIVNGVILSSIGMDVPEEIQKIFNISDVNIQQSFDAPFLLSLSPGEVARFFNTVIKLDDIDILLKKVNQIKRENQNYIIYNETNTVQTEKQLKKLEWIEKTEIILERAEKLQGRIDKNNISFIALSNMVSKYKEIIDYALSSITINIDCVENIENSLLENNIILNKLVIIISEYKKCDELISILLPENIFTEIEIICNTIKDKHSRLYILENLIDDYIDVVAENESIDIELGLLKNTFPEICPVCGGKL